MAIDHLTLPNFIEPPPRIPVVARYCGPVMAAMRRAGGYRFLPPAGPGDESRAWLGSITPRG
jgi:hypothetical protein